VEAEAGQSGDIGKREQERKRERESERDYPKQLAK